MQRPARAASSGSPPLGKSRAPGRRRGRASDVSVSTASRSLVGTRDPIELCRLMYETLNRQMDATIFFLGLYDPASQTFEVVWQVENGKELSGGSFPHGTGLSSRVALS